MSLRDRVKNESAEGGGYRPHPVGNFAAVITEVREKTTKQGRPYYMVKIKTTEGTANHAIFINRAQNIQNELANIAGSIEAAEDMYVKGLGRLLRSYRDLGLQEPDGASEFEIEEQAYGRLGEWIGRPCMLNVAQNDKDPQNPWININPAQPGQATPAFQAEQPPAYGQQQAAPAPGYGQPAHQPQPGHAPHGAPPMPAQGAAAPHQGAPMGHQPHQGQPAAPAPAYGQPMQQAPQGQHAQPQPQQQPAPGQPQGLDSIPF